MSPISIGLLYNLIVFVLALAFIGFLQRGFFWPFIRVKVSFGKYVLIKIRAINRDHYRMGEINEGFLIYKHTRKELSLIHI